MPTQKKCAVCEEKIGVASKTCHHCGAKQPLKEKLQKKKKKITAGWKERQKKNCSFNKTYDSSHLLLHKWELLERHPILFLGKKSGRGFVSEWLCPWYSENEIVKASIQAMEAIYGRLLNVIMAPVPATAAGESTAANSEDPPMSTSQTPPVSSCPVPTSQTPPVSSCPVPTSQTPPVSSCPVPTSQTPPVSSCPVPSSQTPPVSSCPVPTSQTPPVSSCPVPTSQTPPVSSCPVPTSQTPPVSSCPVPTSQTPPVSSCPVPTSQTPPVSSCHTHPQKNRRKRGMNQMSECPIHQGSSSFPYKKILRQRIREGRVEVLVQWHPCSGCGTKWKNSWEPKDNIQN
ncbi:flocculation protein FLO11-like isoform X2 [Sparus aurata]|uniref:flocculation protein FLO11-like isoform X2 n=1 Tax=Sparus aurata TaxID=8175 RepID=UPI0011C16523|nr:flocculation protein FLO11-like isoform X2 [Sparus aurata]